MTKRLLSMLLAIIIVVGMLPVTGSAATVATVHKNGSVNVADLKVNDIICANVTITGEPYVYYGIPLYHKGSESGDWTPAGTYIVTEVFKENEHDAIRVDDVTAVVTLNANGGTVTPSTLYLLLDETGPLPVPTREGYTFTGWKTKRDVVTTEYHPTLIADRDQTLVAQWESEKFQITTKMTGNANDTWCHLSVSYNGNQNATEAAAGDWITITANCSSPYTLESVKFYKTNDPTTGVTVVTPGEKYQMPAYDITVEAVFDRQPVELLSINFSSHFVTLKRNQTTTLTPNVFPLDHTDTLVWSSSNPSVATVNENGIVTTHSAGQAVIQLRGTAKPNIYDAVTVTVEPAPSYYFYRGTSDFGTFLVNGKNGNFQIEQDTIVTITPEPKHGFEVDQVYYCLGSWGGPRTDINKNEDGLYVFTMPNGNPYINVTFKKAETAAVTGVSLNKTSTTLTVDGTETLTATVTPDNATNKTVTWSTSNDSVATVDNGVVTAVGAGTATITVTTVDGSKTATCTVTVTAAAVDPSIEITKAQTENGSFDVSCEEQNGKVMVTVTPAPAEDYEVDKVTYTPAGGTETEVTPVNGVYSFSKPDGEITVKVLFKEKAPATVAVENVSLDKTSTTLTVDGTETLTATVTPDNATNKTVTWSTSDDSVATVDNGVVTAVGAGNATITATAGGKSATCTVTVVEEYDVWVGGVQVTSANKDNITAAIGSAASGTATYDPDDNTLTLNGFSYSGEGYNNAAIYASDGSLNVKLVGTNTISNNNGYAILNSRGTLKIYGSNKTTDKLVYHAEKGIYTPQAVIENATVQGTGGGIQMMSGESKITNSIVTAAVSAQQFLTITNSEMNGNITVLNMLTLTGSKVTSDGKLDLGEDGNYSKIKNSEVDVAGIDADKLYIEDGSKVTARGAMFSGKNAGISLWGSLSITNSTVEARGTDGAIVRRYDGATITVGNSHKVFAGDTSGDAAYVASPDNTTYANKYVKIVPAYTITFASNGGSACDSIVVEAGSEVTSLPTSTLANHTFGGWYTSEDLSGTAVESVKPTANMTLYAKWTVKQYTITFNTDGGSAVAPITAAQGTAITAPDAPTKEGYTFAGWTPAVPATMPAENMTIKAKWTANSYDAIFNADGGAWADGETTKTVPTAFGSVIVAPADPAKTGYIFAGWTPAVGNMDSVDGKAFTATWTINQYTVTFKVDGETVEAYTQTVNHGGDADMTKTIPHKVGYDDKAPIWSIDGVNAADGKNITADTEFIAVYYQNAPGTYEDTTDSSGNAAAVEIETPIQDLMDAVPLTQEELRQVALGEDVKFWMVSADDSSAISAEDKTLADNARSGDIVGMYLDIDLFKQIGANSPVQVTTLNEKIAVTLDVPASLINSNTNKTRTYYVIRVHNGAATVIKPAFDAANRTLTFKTDRFSTYAITYKDTSKPAAVTPATGDNSHILMFTGMAVTSLLCAAMLIVFFPRKKGKYER